MNTLDTKELNASLSGGYTSEGLQKEGQKMTFLAVFSGLSGTTTARLEQSVDGATYNEIPDSEVTVASGSSQQMWNDCGVLPSGSFVRVRVNSISGTLVRIKMLS